MIATSFSFGRAATRAAITISIGVILAFFVRILLGAKLYYLFQESPLTLWMFNIRFSAILSLVSLISIALSAIGVVIAKKRISPLAVLCCSILCFGFVLFIFLNTTSLSNVSIDIKAGNVSYWNTIFGYPPVL